jgi:predicted esterase
MVRIPARTTPMLIVGLEQYQGQSVPEFLADKYEVTNAQYKQFVDAGGYQNPTYWSNKFVKDGKVISREEALKSFIDKTGKPGPAGWEVGSYPNGLENHPVSGISWYEADAYARFAGKQLPTVFHWSVIAETNRTMVIVPKSNYNGQSTVPVGSLEGISSFGIYDLAGNVREWCANPSGTNGLYFSLGGAWNDATYAFNDAYMVQAMDRSVGNGFRCIQLFKEDQSFAETSRPVSMMFRDYTKEKPVDDQTFEFFRRQYAYDPGPINAQVKVMADTGIWHVEQITMDAAYNKERLVIYLFMPRNGKAPVQPVIYYPGSNVIYEQKFTNTYVNRLEFIIRSGRAIAIPVFKGTFERHDELKSDLPNNSVFYKDHVIMWRKDLSRTIDYLETRTDIAANKIGYFGWSWGGYQGGILPAIETRIQCIVLHVGGMVMNPSLPEVDQLNFLPRVKQPVLMLNGKHDLFFPVETAQKPMFNLLGTPAKDKKIIIYDAGHLVPRTELIRETLLWYDKYLGTVN